MKSIWKDKLKEDLIEFIERRDNKEITTIEDAFDVLDSYMETAEDSVASGTIERVLVFLTQDIEWFRDNANYNSIKMVKELNRSVN